MAELVIGIGGIRIGLTSLSRLFCRTGVGHFTSLRGFTSLTPQSSQLRFLLGFFTFHLVAL